jgi:hypothetical protein
LKTVVSLGFKNLLNPLLSIYLKRKEGRLCAIFACKSAGGYNGITMNVPKLIGLFSSSIQKKTTNTSKLFQAIPSAHLVANSVELLKPRKAQKGSQDQLLLEHGKHRNGQQHAGKMMVNTWIWGY